ncbi:hypothetical protein ACIP1X_09155 [Pseudomonas sp. NPDC088885]|jgi:hypothetical protein
MNEILGIRRRIPPVGAAEGCDLLIFSAKKQKIAAFGSSFGV